MPESEDVKDGAAQQKLGDLPPPSNEPSNERIFKQGQGDEDLESSRERTPPPLPPRPFLPTTGSLQTLQRATRPQLLSTTTTALSLTDVHIQTHSDTASLRSSPASRSVSRKHSYSHLGRFSSTGNSDGADSPADSRLGNENVLDDRVRDFGSPVLKALGEDNELDDPFATSSTEDQAFDELMKHEFDPVNLERKNSQNEQDMLVAWTAKLKHFFILSASGKPIYSRHGDDQLISHYVGVVQTLISFYQESDDPLRGFTAGNTRFVMLSKGPLNLVAVSRLGESEAQLRTQLESLYMQILSTLTLPSMEGMFSKRPSTDLRRPLQGTDVLLDGLADGFTRGSPSTLLSALECLRLRKTQRKLIDETFLKVRSKSLLYGLIVAGGCLVSVVRPKKHSLHPGDLHLVFNMLFEAGGVKAGGGENWIPICLPGFNNTGFLYMYVSFLSIESTEVPDTSDQQPSQTRKDDELAIVLISADREAFYELRSMRDELVAQLESRGSMSVIRTAVRKGHASCSDIVPGTALKHFLYKSRGNVQFVMPSFEPHFQDAVARRKLMSLYNQLHDSLHSKAAHLKVQHSRFSDATALAWETPLFEMYCVAGPQASRASLTQGANRVVQWIRLEEERVFIIGGAVF